MVLVDTTFSTGALRRFRERIGEGGVPRRKQAREDGDIQVERVDRNASRDVLAHPADVRPCIRRGDDRCDRRAGEAGSRIIDDLRRVARRHRPFEDHDTIGLTDFDDVPSSRNLDDARGQLRRRTLR